MSIIKWIALGLAKTLGIVSSFVYLIVGLLLVVTISYINQILKNKI